MSGKNKVKKGLWDHRSLILSFAILDLKLRYRNSFLGFLWSVVEPMLILSVLYFVFTNLFKTEIENFVLYLLLGLVIWFFFNRSTSMSLTSLIGRKNILTKIYFPREILVISSCLTAFFMTVFEIGIFFLFMIPVQFVPTITLVWFPLLVLFGFVFVLGISFILSVLNARLNDVQHIWTVVLQAGFFLMPIFYKIDIFPLEIQKILSAFPMVAFLETSRQVILYNENPNSEMLMYLIGISSLVLVIGYAIFRKYEWKIIEEL